MKLKDIKGVFKPPKKRYYLGKLYYGCPHFYPRNFVSTILYIRKLKLKSTEEKEKYAERYPHLKDEYVNKFSNLPTVRRSKYWITRIFKTWYYIEVGWPIAIKSIELGWKDK